jgi:hypothetical protein
MSPRPNPEGIECGPELRAIAVVFLRACAENGGGLFVSQNNQPSWFQFVETSAAVVDLGQGAWPR